MLQEYTEYQMQSRLLKMFKMFFSRQFNFDEKNVRFPAKRCMFYSFPVRQVRKGSE